MIFRFRPSLCVSKRLRVQRRHRQSRCRSSPRPEASSTTTVTWAMQRRETWSLPLRVHWLPKILLWWSPNQHLARLSFENLCRLLNFINNNNNNNKNNNNNNSKTSFLLLQETLTLLRPWCRPISFPENRVRSELPTRPEIANGPSPATSLTATRPIWSRPIWRHTFASTQVISISLFVGNLLKLLVGIFIKTKSEPSDWDWNFYLFNLFKRKLVV